MFSQTLLSTQVDDLVAFYGMVFDAEPDEHAPGRFARFVRDTTELHIWSTASFYETWAEAPKGPVIVEHLHGASVYPTLIQIEVDDAAASYDRLEGKVDLLKGISTQAWGNTSFWLRDPDNRMVNAFSTEG